MNLKILAATLRTKATRLDKAAWQLETYAVLNAPRAEALKANIASQRQLAQQLRTLANKLAPASRPAPPVVAPNDYKKYRPANLPGPRS